MVEKQPKINLQKVLDAKRRRSEEARRIRDARLNPSPTSVHWWKKKWKKSILPILHWMWQWLTFIITTAIPCAFSFAWRWIKWSAFNVIMFAKERSVICIRLIFEWLHLTFGRRHRMVNESTETWRQRVLASIRLPPFCSNVGSTIWILLNYVLWIAKMYIFISGLISIFMPHLDLNKAMHTVYDYSQRMIKADSGKGNVGASRKSSPKFKVGDFVVITNMPTARNAFIKRIKEVDAEMQRYEVVYAHERDGSKRVLPIFESVLDFDVERVITHQQRDDRSVLMYQKSGLEYHSLESMTRSMLDAEIIHYDWQHYHDLSKKISDIESWHAMALRGELKLYFENRGGRKNIHGTCVINAWMQKNSFPRFKKPQFIENCLDLAHEPASFQNRMYLSFCHTFLKTMLWTEQSADDTGHCMSLITAVTETWNIQNIDAKELNGEDWDFANIMSVDNAFKLPQDWCVSKILHGGQNCYSHYVLCTKTIPEIFGRMPNFDVQWPIRDYFSLLRFSRFDAEEINSLLEEGKLVGLLTDKKDIPLDALQGFPFYADINKVVIGVSQSVSPKEHVVYGTRHSSGMKKPAEWMFVDNDEFFYRDAHLKEFAEIYMSWEKRTVKNAQHFYAQSLELGRIKQGE